MKSLTACAALAIPAVLALAWGGCADDDTGGGLIAPPAVIAPTLQGEPAFTAGGVNRVDWNDTGAAAYLVQQAVDAEFLDVDAQTDWIGGTFATFSDLDDGETYYYRIRARDNDGNESPWSAPQATTMDASPPVTGMADEPADQTSLTFRLQLQATDTGSGVAKIELWYSVNDGQRLLQGDHGPGEITFIADGPGVYRFYTAGVDSVGNRAEPAGVPDVTTRVPEPIIITDVTGEDFDITHAVLAYNMAVRDWEFGLGRRAIRPIVNPLMLEPGQAGYLDDDNLSPVIGLNIPGDVRAYKVADLSSREVVDDHVGDQYVAVTY